MLNILRRGPASVARSLYATSIYSNLVRANHCQSARHLAPRTICPSAHRFFVSSPQGRRSATAAAYEDEAIEEEIKQETQAEKPPSNAQLDASTRQGPVTKFKELAEQGLVSPVVIDTITQEMGLETMTQVQSLTINESIKGLDILAQARTGTGKTLAFLIPLLQNIINYDPTLEKRSRSGRSGSSTDIRAIIISPTRELAEQIAVEARKVSRNTAVIVQTAVGGTQKSFGLQKIKMEGCHILVGTPGRLNDILSDPYSRVRAPNLSAFVLDEADRLLDQGFAPDIEAIQNLLPDRRDVDRQTLLYSATIPQEVMHIVRKTMKPNFKFVRTVQEGEQQTHERVAQKLVNVGGFENILPALVELCKREISLSREDGARPFKAIVYFAATADVSLARAILQNLGDPRQRHESPLHPARVIEIHSKLTQNGRTRAAEDFRRAQSAILLSSDVTARGMDFPNVSHVIQIGLPQTQEQYVHRIGRTARGDKSGEGWTFVTALESRDIRHRLPDMPLQRDNTLETAQIDMRKDAQLPESSAKILDQVGEASKIVPRGLKVASYMATLGVYSRIPNKQVLVDAINDLSKYGWGLEEPPMVNSGLARKLGYSNAKGLNIGFEERDNDRGRGAFGRDRYSSPGAGGDYGSQRSNRFSSGGRDRRSGSSYERDDRSNSSYSQRGQTLWPSYDRGDRNNRNAGQSGNSYRYGRDAQRRYQ